MTWEDSFLEICFFFKFFAESVLAKFLSAEMFSCCKKKSNKSLDELKKDIVIDDHEIPLEALLRRFTSSETAGISEAEAANRFKRDGPNALTPPKQTSKWVKLAGSVFGGFNFLLWCAAIASGIGYGMDMSMSEDEEVPKDNVGEWNETQGKPIASDVHGCDSGLCRYGNWSFRFLPRQKKWKSDGLIRQHDSAKDTSCSGRNNQGN